MENTFYGISNRLQVSKLLKLAVNHYCVESYESADDSRVANSKSTFLHIVFFSDDIVRFHYCREEPLPNKIKGLEEIGDLGFKLWANPYLQFQDFNLDKDYAQLKSNFALASDRSLGEFKDDSEIVLETKTLRVEIATQALAVNIFDHVGNSLSSDMPQLGYWTDGMEVRCYKHYEDLNSPPIIYGLGDKTGSINHWGKRLRNRPVDALGYDATNTDPLYKDIPFWIELNRKTKKAHGIFFDSFADKFFDFGKERKPVPYYYFSAQGDELNYYFINGPQINDVLARYLELTGKPVLMPMFTFGYLASSMAYTDADKSAEKILQMLEKSKEEGIKTTAFHLSSGYTLDANARRMQFQWNPGKFPDPESFAEECKNKYGVELCVNLKPVLLIDHPDFNKACEEQVFLSDTLMSDVDNSQEEAAWSLGNDLESKALNYQPQIVDYWGGKGAHMDFTKEQSQTWWKEQIKSKLLVHKIRGIWNDNNEYEIYQNHPLKEREREMSLLMSKLSWDASLEQNPEQRPWILSRSGFSGIQKYAQTWTGDNYSSWEGMQYDIALVNSMSMSGLLHAACDIGGFWGETPGSELLMRWIQIGAFSPRFCIHSYKSEATEPWLYKDSHPEHYEVIKRYMNLRHGLMPYLYQANYHASSRGQAIQRITAADFQYDEKTWEQSFDYLLGDALLVAPIFEPAAQKRKVYLPGTVENKWINFFDYSEYLAGQDLECETLRDIPVFVKANSVIPILEQDRGKEILTLKLFINSEHPRDEYLEYELYEDDGDSLNYLRGNYLKTTFKFRFDSKGFFEMSISKQEGDYVSPYETVTFDLIYKGASTRSRIHRL